MTRFSRRAFLTAGTAALSLAAIGQSVSASPKPIRIGVVLPSKTGPSFIRSSANEFIGDGGRWGTILADSQLGSIIEQKGYRLQLLMATSPNVEAAIRAGERLVEIGDIHGLIGGVGEGQAKALSDIAARAKVPFFNIGETDETLRGASCNRYAFHVEASDGMYLDALAKMAGDLGYKRWHIVGDTTERGARLLERAKIAAEKAGASITGNTTVRPDLTYYYNEASKMDVSDADVAIILLQAFDQFSFIMQMEDAGVHLPLLSFPHTITQTRDFIAAARHRLPDLNPRQRVALWDTTNPEPEAHAFNEKIRGQWGEAADPTAWAGYHAVKIILDTVLATGSTDAEAIISHLENPDTTFDLMKGPGVSFRPWDHQLRQPLYTLTVDQEAEWQRMQLDTRINIAQYKGMIPEGDPGADPKAWLDQLGDLTEASCSSAK